MLNLGLLEILLLMNNSGSNTTGNNIKYPNNRVGIENIISSDFYNEYISNINNNHMNIRYNINYRLPLGVGINCGNGGLTIDSKEIKLYLNIGNGNGLHVLLEKEFNGPYKENGKVKDLCESCYDPLTVLYSVVGLLNQGIAPKRLEFLMGYGSDNKTNLLIAELVSRKDSYTYKVYTNDGEIFAGISEIYFTFKQGNEGYAPDKLKIKRGNFIFDANAKEGYNNKR